MRNDTLTGGGYSGTLEKEREETDKTGAEGKKVSRSSPILGASAVSAGARRVGFGRACPEGKREDPPGAKPCRRRQGKTEAQRKVTWAVRRRGAREATADAERTLDNSHWPFPRGQTRTGPRRPREMR